MVNNDPILANVFKVNSISREENPKEF